MAKQSKKKKGERKVFTSPPFRISFPKLFVAEKMDEDDAKAKPKFSFLGIWRLADFTAADKVRWKEMVAERDRLIREELDCTIDEIEAKLRGIRDGKSKAGMEGFGEGTRFANFASLNRPGVIDIRKKVISPEEGNEDLIYPGAICRATFHFWAYDNKSKGVALGLQNVQKIKDGPRLDSRVAAEDDFDEDVEEGWLDADDSDGDGDGDDFG